MLEKDDELVIFSSSCEAGNLSLLQLQQIYRRMAVSIITCIHTISSSIYPGQWLHIDWSNWRHPRVGKLEDGDLGVDEGHLDLLCANCADQYIWYQDRVPSDLQSTAPKYFMILCSLLSKLQFWYQRCYKEAGGIYDRDDFLQWLKSRYEAYVSYLANQESVYIEQHWTVWS